MSCGFKSIHTKKRKEPQRADARAFALGEQVVLQRRNLPRLCRRTSCGLDEATRHSGWNITLSDNNLDSLIQPAHFDVANSSDQTPALSFRG